MGSDPMHERLRAAGLKVTGPRLAVLEALERAGPHSDVDAIAVAARTKAPISTQAVYDGLNALSRVGIVRHIEPAGHPARYELRVGDNHHHVICRQCGLTRDVDCAVGSAPCLTAGDDSGFLIDEAEVVFWGLCPDCQSVAATPSSP
ncbi:transcriptional repressor [bacterium]|nr:MAG: transcriptional repressor [bacterium]